MKSKMKPASYRGPNIVPMHISIVKLHTLGRKASFCNLLASSYLNAKNLAVFSKMVKIPASVSKIQETADKAGTKSQSI